MKDDEPEPYFRSLSKAKFSLADAFPSNGGAMISFSAFP